VRRLAALRPATGTTAGAVLDFLASLQPAWWVLRAFLPLAVLSGDVFVAVLLTFFAAPVSIWLGHWTRRDRRWLWAVVPLNGLAAMVLLVVVADGPSTFGSPSPANLSPVHRSGVWQDSEREILDIRPVDAAGNPLTGVYLFDQDGRPIDTSGGVGCDAGHDDGSRDYAADGRSVESNAPYPRGTWDYDRTGECRFTPPGPLVIAVPSTTTPGAPTAGPSAPPSAGPTAAPPAGSAPPATGASPPSPVSPSTPPVAPAPPVGPVPQAPAVPPTS
jgi:hypothetical protein